MATLRKIVLAQGRTSADRGPGSRPGGCSWCATTSPRNTNSRSATGAPITTLGWWSPPGNASWLNWIECEFTVCALAGFDRYEAVLFSAGLRRRPGGSVPRNAGVSTVGRIRGSCLSWSGSRLICRVRPHTARSEKEKGDPVHASGHASKERPPQPTRTREESDGQFGPA
jgi:hypothetical protein